MSDTIKQAFNTLTDFVTTEMTRNIKLKEVDEAEAVIAAGMFLLEQLFQDIHRIANAHERLAESTDDLAKSVDAMLPR